MHFAVNLGEPAQVEIVAVSCSKDADAPAGAIGDEQALEFFAMGGIEIPLPARGAVELRLLVDDEIFFCRRSVGHGFCVAWTARPCLPFGITGGPPVPRIISHALRCGRFV